MKWKYKGELEKTEEVKSLEDSNSQLRDCVSAWNKAQGRGDQTFRLIIDWYLSYFIGVLLCDVCVGRRQYSEN